MTKAMISGSRALGVAVLTTLICVSLLGIRTDLAHAQGKKSPAEKLFDQGLADMLKGRFDTGCPALAASYRLEPLPGVLFTLAECKYKWGKLASALAHYQDFVNRVARMAPGLRYKQRARVKVAKNKIEALKGQVPLLTLVLPPEAPTGTVVKRDGEMVPPVSLGVAIPVDPGEHRIVVSLPDGLSREHKVVMLNAQKKTLRLELPSADVPPTVTATSTATLPPPPPPPPNGDKSGSGHTSRTVALVIGGLGLAGLVVGSITGGMTLAKKSTIEDHCNGAACDADGKEAADSAQTLGLVSTIGFVVGLTGVAAATVIWLAEPFDSDESKTEATGSIRLFSGPVAGDPYGAVLGIEGVW